METTPVYTTNTRYYGQKINPPPKLQRNVWKHLLLYRYYEHALLRTEDKFPAETTKKCM